jgi:hypothetical protein
VSRIVVNRHIFDSYLWQARNSQPFSRQALDQSFRLQPNQLQQFSVTNNKLARSLLVIKFVPNPRFRGSSD